MTRPLPPLSKRLLWLLLLASGATSCGRPSAPAVPEPPAAVSEADPHATEQVASVPAPAVPAPAGSDAGTPAQVEAAAASATDDCVALPYDTQREQIPDDMCMLHLMISSSCVQSFWEHLQAVLRDPAHEGLDEVFRQETRVNRRGKVRLVSPRELKAEFQKLLPAATLAKIVGANPAEVDCLSEGSMIAQGLLWASPDPKDRRMRVEVINWVDPASSPRKD